MWFVAPTWRPYSSSKPSLRVRLRPDALGCEHERVADDPADRVARAARDGRGDEAVRRALEQRHLLAGRGAQRLGVAVAPVLVDERALAQVADARAAAAQEGREHARLGQLAERVARDVDTLLHRRTGVRRSEEDHVAQERGQLRSRSPAWAQALRATRPPIECPTSTSSETASGHAATVPRAAPQAKAPVVGDVHTAVVVGVVGRVAQLGAQARAVGPPAGAARFAATPHRSPSGRGRRPPAAGSRPGRRRRARRGSSATGRPSTRTEIGSCSGLRSRSSRSPTRPLSDREAEAARQRGRQRALRARAPRHDRPRRRGRARAVAPPRAPTTPPATAVVHEADRACRAGT